MIPRQAQALRDIAMKLVLSVAPETTTAYAASNTGMIAMLLQCLAPELDRGVETRIRDIEEMKTLFAGALAQNLDPALAAELLSYGGREPRSLRLQDLDPLHADGLRALITLHAWAEEAGIGSLDRGIWAFLERFTDRHAFALP